MQLSSAELIVTIVFAIVGLLMGFVSGAMPLHKRRKRIVEGKATASTGPSFAVKVATRSEPDCKP